jgi:hypothetical protein
MHRQSLLAPKISVYTTASIWWAADAGRAAQSPTTPTAAEAGQTYLVADGATSDAFGMGAYRLDVNLSPPQTTAPKVQQVSPVQPRALNLRAVGALASAMPPDIAYGRCGAMMISPGSASTRFHQFSQHVNVQADDLAISAAGMPPEDIAGFQYDPQSFTATWTLAKNIDEDEWTIELDGHTASGVRNAAGVFLDGEWTDQSSQFPSGNGVAGGDFVFRFQVMPGDLNRDQAISIFDINLISSNWGVANPYCDPNGDGIVRSSTSTPFRRFGRHANAPGGVAAILVGRDLV